MHECKAKLTRWRRTLPLPCLCLDDDVRREDRREEACALRIPADRRQLESNALRETARLILQRQEEEEEEAENKNKKLIQVLFQDRPSCLFLIVASSLLCCIGDDTSTWFLFPFICPGRTDRQTVRQTDRKKERNLCCFLGVRLC